ncbi:MAG: hypothetical protein Q9213_001324 [Squamulea squamosa]
MSLKIVTQVSPLLSWQTRAPEDGLGQIERKLKLPDVSASIHLNSLVRMLLLKLPRQRLSEFAWDHRCTVDSSVLHILLETQAQSLIALKFDRYSIPDDEDDYMDDVFLESRELPGLQSLSLSSLPEESNRWPAIALLNNIDTLKHLCLGAESFAVKSYYRSGDHFDANLNATVDTFVEHMREIFDPDAIIEPLLSLDTFILKGLDITRFIQLDFCLVNLSALTLLSLESCQGLESLFDTLTGSGTDQSSPLVAKLQLRSLYIRYERSNQQFRGKLMNFLTSISGLTDLSILLESPDEPEHYREVLTRHGRSLRTLVWEERVGRSVGFGGLLDRAHLHEGVEAIAQYCPDLIELSIPFDWHIFTDNTSEYPGESVTWWLWRMKHLRTLNIRNMPPIDPTKTMLPMEELHAAFANSVIKTLLRSPFNGNKSLKTLVLGSFTYRDVRIGLGLRNINDPDLYNYLRPQIYQTDVCYQFEGKPRPMAILFETGTYEKTEAAGGDVEVLRPYWLD